MSFFQHNMLTSLTSNFDERQWVKLIRQTLDEELDEETETPVTIFGVPKTLFISGPDSYIPQQVAIGPYHHLRPELYDMERYKVAAAKRNQRELNNLKLQDIVDHLIKFEVRIRACYHRPVSLGGEALAWLLAVDVSFLLEFFEVCGFKRGKTTLTKLPSRLSHLVDLSGNKVAHDAILRDVVMLENQIPLFVLRMVLECQFSSLDLADDVLLDMLMELSRELSPFDMAAEAAERKIEVKECAHLLDFVYRFIVPVKPDVLASETIEIHEEQSGETDGEIVKNKNSSPAEPSHLRLFLAEVRRILSKLKAESVGWIKTLISSKPVRLFVKLPWTSLSRIPAIKLLKEPVEHIFSTYHKEKTDEQDQSSSSTSKKKKLIPLPEQIKIPSVTQLSLVGVQFVPIHEGITSIKFDAKTLTFYIPVINLDVYSEVVLRNLVAYEACTASGPLHLTRYVELMNGIIAMDLDVKFLCGRGIIINHLKSEEEVVELWNGMSQSSIRLTKVPSLDQLIGDVNKFYDGRWKVIFGKFMKRYVYGTWKILTFLAAVMLLLLMILQAFCEVYSCSRIFPIKGLQPTLARP
ncbi:hypothetical protein Salat_1565200 [Sesamum alatum]|uniref:Uncharacterized protein n=1 Tax=Sesamum alatum TaxID=300844 RepID=A0AAE1YDC3_9LAMI|nr:hypothetical protein Salat_1565200 [Sesamum alatum]